jgi:hypothetical protein
MRVSQVGGSYGCYESRCVEKSNDSVRWDSKRQGHIWHHGMSVITLNIRFVAYLNMRQSSRGIRHIIDNGYGGIALEINVKLFLLRSS